MSKNANNKSDISKRRSISVVARDVYGTTGSILKWIARDQGPFYGEGGSFPITEEYKQYEHCTQSGYGESYDPEFFEGLVVTPEIIEETRQRISDYRRRERERKARESEAYWSRVKAAQAQNAVPAPHEKEPGGILRGLVVFERITFSCNC